MQVSKKLIIGKGTLYSVQPLSRAIICHSTENLVHGRSENLILGRRKNLILGLSENLILGLGKNLNAFPPLEQKIVLSAKLLFECPSCILYFPAVVVF